MRLPIIAAGTALLLCTTPAFAQNSAPNTPAPPTSTNTCNATANKGTPLRDNIRCLLQRSGFTDIRMLPSSFVIRAKDQEGDPVVMSVSPDSVTEISELGTSGANGVNGSKASQFLSVGSNDDLSSNLVGLDVYNNSNQNIGEIKDIALSPQGRAQAYILSIGGFLGMGQRYVAMNPSDIKISYNNSDHKWHASTNATTAELKSAPEFQYSGRQTASKS